MIHRLFRAAAAAALIAGPASAQGLGEQGPAGITSEVTFVVLGHIRGGVAGGLSPKLSDLLEEVRLLDPSFVVLTGDIIWGDVQGTPPDPVRVEAEWDEVDSALATLGVPVYRVPGNHDISDVGTRDIWLRRYGSPDQTVRIAGLRLLFLSSSWIPEDGDLRQRLMIRGADLDEDQVEWLESQLDPSATEPTFLFMHHLLWWERENGPWWTQVHPLLAQAGVDAVFSGDYGPLKFSTMERDGVSYFQTSIEDPVSLEMLQNNLSSRVLSAQFDNFLEVVVRDPEFDVRVHTLAEVSSGEFTPDRYRAITTGPPPPTLWMRLLDLVGTPKRITALLAALGCALIAGWWVGRRWP